MLVAGLLMWCAAGGLRGDGVDGRAPQDTRRLEDRDAGERPSGATSPKPRANVMSSRVWAAARGGVERDAQRTRRRRKVIDVEVTAYCTEGTTASGTQTRRGIVAADPSVLPLGSVVRLEGVSRPYNRMYVVRDTGRAIKGAIIDIFMHDCAAAERFGRQNGRVRVLRSGPK